MDGGGFPTKPAARDPLARPNARPGGVVVGPGARLSLLARHLACAGATVHQVEDLLDMFAAARGTRSIVVDAAELPREDLGLVRRALRQSGAALVVVADDPRQGLVRELCAQHGARWLPWPPTLDDIAQLADGDGAASSARSAAEADVRGAAFERGRFDEAPVRGSATSADGATPFEFHADPASTTSSAHGAGAEPSHADFAARDAELDAIDEILARGRSSPVPGLDLPRPLDLPRAGAGEADHVDDAPPREAPATEAGGGTTIRVPGFPDPLLLPDSMPAELPLGHAPMPAPGPAAGHPQGGAIPAADPSSGASSARLAVPPAGARLPDALGGPLSLESDAKSGTTPAWMRDQVADLADQTTRLDLSLTVLTESLDGLAEERKHDLEAHVEHVRGETARLMGFARTLAFLATPPARGSQRFDIGEVLKVYVASLAKQGPDAPRLLYRSAGPVEVRSDRGLLGVVFDALLFVARECSSRGVVVRAQVLPPADGRVAVEIEFPAGPLDGRTVEHIFTPYALRRVLPNLGPNALAAAQAIVVGQGGSLTLGFLDKGRASWRLELPVADA
jgi:hypothetical protein